MKRKRKRTASVVFKKGELVCFLLPKAKDASEKAWHMGKVILFHQAEMNQDPVAEVSVCEIPEHFPPGDLEEEEWSSLALVPIDFSHEAIVLNRLDGRTCRKGRGEKRLRTVRISTKDLYKATYMNLRAVLTGA